MSYSGFLSNFTGTIIPAIDILSTVTYHFGTTGSGGGGNYSACYFTIGNILVQFTDFTDPIDNLDKSSQNTINFPVSFTNKPWCVVATPTNTGNNTNLMTVLTNDITPTSFKVYIGSGENIGVTYIAIGSGPPIPIPIL